jgi:serine/threonine protein kinase
MGGCFGKGDDKKKPDPKSGGDKGAGGGDKGAAGGDKGAGGQKKPDAPERAEIKGKKVDLDKLPDDFIIFEPLEDYYTLGEEIGKGGFSIVYQAERKKDGKEFAVKCIKKDMVEGEDIKLLRREVQIMKKLKHPNILKLYEVYEDDKQFFLVMELVKGKELFDKIVERGMYSERDASNIIYQVVSAVDYLHDNGIAHRDLKVNYLSTLLFPLQPALYFVFFMVELTFVFPARELAVRWGGGKRNHQDSRYG